MRWLAVKPVREVLIAMPVAVSCEQLAGHVGGGRHALVGVQRDGGVLDQPVPPENVVGRAQLLGEGQVQVSHLARNARADSLGVQPRLPST